MHEVSNSFMYMQLYRYHWWAVWFEFPLVLAIIGSIAGFLGGCSAFSIVDAAMFFVMVNQ